MRQDLEENGTEQSSDRETHQSRDPARRRGERKQGGKRNADHAARDGRRRDPRNRRHALTVLEPDEARHSAGGPVSTEGKETLLARGAEPAAMDFRDTGRREPLPRKLVEVDEVRPVLPWRERCRSSGVSTDEGPVDVLSDFVATRSDSRSDVGDEVSRGHLHGLHDVFYDSAR